MRRCYIIVRQLFYLSNGEHHQIADQNPIAAVYTTQKAAVKVVRSLVQNRIESSDYTLQAIVGAINSEVVFRLGVADSQGNCKVAYSVIKQGMMV